MSQTAAGIPARFLQGEPVTILVMCTAADEWPACSPGGGTKLMLGSRLADGTLVTVPCDYPGITVIHGDIRPTLLRALREAIVHHHDGDCGDPEHLGWVENYERAVDVLEAAG